MTETAKEARRAYMREWAKKNRARVKQHNERYWEKVAAEQRAANTVEQAREKEGVNE